MQRLRSLLPRFHAPNQLTSNDLKRPFFEARPPWWAKFTWGFIVCDLIVTSSMTEATWRKWTRRASDAERAAGRTEPVLRPAWQRAGLVASHLVFGVGLAVALLIGRSRVVHRLQVLGAPPQLFIQGAHNHGARGVLVPFKSTNISPGRDDTEVILRVDGVRGHWWIGLTQASVDGTEATKLRAREALMGKWGVRKGAPAGASGWVGGPVVQNI